MKLAAAMMARNEAPVIADSIGHLLTGVGVDRVYVADNGSSDGTGAILSRLAAWDDRVRVTRAPGGFRQPEVMRDLICQAMADGADWVLPNDADEFLWMDGAALRETCAKGHGFGALQLRVSNFAQLRRVRTDRPGTLATMVFRALPMGTMQDAVSLVCKHGVPFLRMCYPTKLLLRAAPDLWVERGQHGAEGLAGPIAAEPVGELLHAPIRSRDDLQTRQDHAMRLEEVAPTPEVGWHLKRLSGLTVQGLEEEWRRNSIGLARPSGCGYVWDPRLAWIWFRQRRCRRVAHIA